VNRLGKIKKYTKKIDNLEKKCENIERRIELERKRAELGDISKADFIKKRFKLNDKKKILHGKITRLANLRVALERESGHR